MQLCLNFLVLLCLSIPLTFCIEVENAIGSNSAVNNGEKFIKIQLSNEDGDEAWCTCDKGNVCECTSPSNPNKILPCIPFDKKRVLSCIMSACTCDASGKKWICSLGLCLSRRPRSAPVAADLKNTPCAPNDYFLIDCNRCYCNIDMTGYLCTENLCSYGDSSNKNGTILEIANSTTTTMNLATNPTNENVTAAATPPTAQNLSGDILPNNGTTVAVVSPTTNGSLAEDRGGGGTNNQTDNEIKNNNTSSILATLYK